MGWYHLIIVVSNIFNRLLINRPVMLFMLLLYIKLLSSLNVNHCCVFVIIECFIENHFCLLAGANEWPQRICGYNYSSHKQPCAVSSLSKPCEENRQMDQKMWNV